MPYRLETSSQIIRFIENLDHYIEYVKIDEVSRHEFHFMVKVPLWYKIVFGYFLRKKIQIEVSKRMLIGVGFKFDLYSKTWF